MRLDHAVLAKLYDGKLFSGLLEQRTEWDQPWLPAVAGRKLHRLNLAALNLQGLRDWQCIVQNHMCYLRGGRRANRLLANYVKKVFTVSLQKGGIVLDPSARPLDLEISRAVLLFCLHGGVSPEMLVDAMKNPAQIGEEGGFTTRGAAFSEHYHRVVHGFIVPRREHTGVAVVLCMSHTISSAALVHHLRMSCASRMRLTPVQQGAPTAAAAAPSSPPRGRGACRSTRGCFTKARLKASRICTKYSGTSRPNC